jgi:hypothetical protein
MAPIEERLKPVGKREHDKAVKTLAGVAVALVLGMAVLYGIRHTSPNIQTASDRPTMSQKAADSTHMPERL